MESNEITEINSELVNIYKARDEFKIKRQNCKKLIEEFKEKSSVVDSLQHLIEESKLMIKNKSNQIDTLNRLIEKIKSTEHRDKRIKVDDSGNNFFFFFFFYIFFFFFYIFFLFDKIESTKSSEGSYFRVSCSEDDINTYDQQIRKLKKKKKKRFFFF